MKTNSCLLFLLAVFNTASAAKVVIGARLKGPKGERKLDGATDGLSEKSSKKKSKSHKRICSNTASGDTVQLGCSSGKKKDTISYRVSTSTDGAQIDVKYKDDTRADDGSHVQTDSEYQVFFYKLIEYVPAEDDGMAASRAYDWGDSDASNTTSASEVVREIDLSKWNNFTDLQMDQDEAVSTFSVSTDDGLVDLFFTLNNQVDNKTQLSTANKIQIDVAINNFPWLRNNSFVALLSTVQSKMEVKSHYRGHAHSRPGGDPKKEIGARREPKDVQVRFADSTSDIGEVALPIGEYTWVTEAEVTDANTNETKMDSVIATSPLLHEVDTNSSATTRIAELGDRGKVRGPSRDSSEGDDETTNMQYIAFSFVDSSQASRIFWDPQAGIGYESAASTASATLSLFVGGVIGLLAL